MRNGRHNLWLCLLVIAGCGGGSGGIETLPPADVSSPPGVIVTGQVTKGPLIAAGIALSPINAFGAVSGLPVATATTAADGSFTATIPPGSGPLLVRSSGGRYIDEADREPVAALRRQITLADTEGLESLLPAGETSITVSVVTQALLDKTRRETQLGTFMQFFAANRAQATAAYGFDIVTTPPANPVSPDPAAPLASQQYAMLLGGIANLVNRFAIEAGLTEPDIDSILAVAADLSDGRIDAMVAGTPVMVGNVQAGVFSLNDEIARFRNNNDDAYLGVGALVVDESTLSISPPSPVPNVAPVAAPAMFQINRGATLSVTAPGVLDGATDGDGNPLIARLVTGPANALVFNLQDDGSFSYVHNGGPPGVDAFDFVAFDGLAESDPQTVTIQILNRIPVAGADTATVAEGGSVDIAVLANDSDGDNDPLTVTLVDAPVNGQLVVAAGGTVTYTHDDSETTSDSFTYVANDGIVDSAPATVSISVTPVNDPPVAIDDAATVAEGGTVSARVLDNDTDGDTLLLTARLIDGPLNGVPGTFDLASNGVFSYTHNGSETASDSFTYVANDGEFDSNVATVFITVTPVNDPPVAGNDQITAGRGGTVTMLDTGSTTVLSNDTDAEGDTLNAQLVDAPANGQLGFNPDGTFSYTHDGGMSDSDSFTYVANDGMDDSNLATVSITITNTAPVAARDCIVVAEGASVSVVNSACPAPRPLARLQVNKRQGLPRPVRGPDFFTGVSGTLQLLSQPPDSVEPFALQSDLTLPVFVEQPSFGLSRPAVINLTETGMFGPGGNDGSNAAGCLPTNTFIGSALIHGDSTQGFPTWNGGFTLNQPLIGLITEPDDLGASDFLMGLPAVIYPRDADPTRGLDLAGQPGDTLTIEPDRLAVSGIDFQLEPSTDPQLDDARIVVSPPLLPDLFVSVAGVTPDPVGLSSEPRQIDKDLMPPVAISPRDRPLRIIDRRRAVVSLPTPGMYTFDVSSAQVSYGSMDPVVPGQPVQLLFDGPVTTLTVALAGDYEFVVSQGVQVPPPGMQPDLSLVVNGPLAPSLLSNDTDDNQDPLTVTEITAQPMSGMVSIEPDGTFVYTHDGSETAVDSFGYRISDGIDSADAVVTVMVLPVDDPPVAVNDIMVPIDEGGSVSMLLGGSTSVLDNDFDAEADNNTAQLLDPPASAALTLNSDGTFLYQHDGSPFSTSDVFTYVVESAFTGSCVARVTVLINPINDPPTTSGIADVNDLIGVGGRTIDLSAAFDDEEDPDDALLFEVVDNTNPGIFISVNVSDSDLELLYEASGSSTLTVRATDTGGLFVETAFTVSLQSGQPLVLNLTGMVTATTGAFDALTPVGTMVSGPLDVNPFPLVGPADINTIDVNVGGFCFSTGVDTSGCPLGGTLVPITSIDAAALDLSSPPGVGGTLAITAFSPSFMIAIPISFDFDAGTFFADGGALGTVEGTVTLSQ